MNRKKAILVTVVAFVILLTLMCVVSNCNKELSVKSVKVLSAVENPTTGTCCPGGDDTCVIGKYEFDNRYYQAEGPCKKE